MRFTMSTGSFGSTKVARPSGVEVETAGTVASIGDVGAIVPDDDVLTDSFASLHAPATVRSRSASKPRLRNDMEPPETVGELRRPLLSGRPAKPYVGSADGVTWPLVRINGKPLRITTSCPDSSRSTGSSRS